MRHLTEEEKKILEEMDSGKLTKEEYEERRKRLREIDEKESWPFV